MPYEKAIKHIVTTIVGEYDDDGELIGERSYHAPGQGTAIYHPFGLKLEEHTHRINRELVDGERERLLKGSEARR